MSFTGITPTQHSGFIPEIWLATALGRLPQYINLARTITRDTDIPTGEMFSVGKTLHLPKRGSIVANDRNAAGQYTIQSPQSSTVDLTLSNWWEATFAIDSAAIAFQNQNTQAGYIEDSLIALAEQIEGSIALCMAQAAGVPSGNVITVAGALTEANFLTARRKLVDNKVPHAQKKFGVISSGNTAAVLALDRFVRFDALGVSNNISNGTIGNGIPLASVMDGALGRMAGFETAESQFIQHADGSPALDDNYFYAQTAALMASRALPIPEPGTGALGTAMMDEATGITMRLVKSWNPTYGAETITVDVLWGVTLMRPEHLVLVRTAAQ